MVKDKKRAKGRIWWGIFVILFVLYFVKLPYFYAQPGDAMELSSFIDVEGGFKNADGSFMLTTVSMARANVYLYVWAQLGRFRELWPLENVKPVEETDEQYFARQRMVMKNSQDNAAIVAYKKAGKEVNITYNGIRFSSIVNGMPAEEHLHIDDLITAIDGERVETVARFNELLQKKREGDSAILTVERDGKLLTFDITLAHFPKHLDPKKERVGIGILYPMVDRTVSFVPPVSINANKIGGPSAGLMFALEIYNQLTEEDLTKGYKIAGTGEVDEEGNVYRIGGVEQKVIAAHESGADIFFVPKEGGRNNSNFEAAKKAAEELGITMKIVGVDTFDEAVQYLKKLEHKK